MKYHYTNGERLPPIMRDGYIKPTDHYLRPRERAVAWFTTRDTFEPTAIPLWRVNDYECVPTLTQLAELANGLYRFGVRDDHPGHSKLHPWLKICRLAGTPKKCRVSLEQISLKEGSNPYTYWGSLFPISIFGCSLEKSMDGVSWEDAVSGLAAGAGG